MAMSKLEAIMEIFASAGKKTTPVAIIQDGTTDKEKIAIGTVNDIFFKAQYEGLTNPAIIMIGDVVKLHPSFIAKVHSVAITEKSYSK